MARKVRNIPAPRDEKYIVKQVKRNETEKVLYQTALYIRLSREDSGKSNGNTVENQKALLTEYIAGKPEFAVYNTYIDNGYSGTNFERPMFQEMMEDIKKGKINCIIVKDLSRLGRSYLEVGNYIEKIFPFFKIRFIAVTDHFDTFCSEKTENGMLVPLKNIINDIYARDISKKVGSALEMQKKSGHYGGGVAPYGYQKSKTEKGRLEIDKEAADIVRNIFQLRAEGYGYCSIVKILNEKEIKSPSAYRYEKGIVKDAKKKDILWKRYAIEDMLRDEVYLGNMVRGKTKSALYIGEKRHRVPKDEWIVIKGTHEPIISQELYDCVQAVNLQRECIHKANMEKTKNQDRIENLFVGKVFCGDCGITMGYSRSSEKSFSFYCPNYKENGLLGCRRKTISHAKLEKVVFEAVKVHVESFLDSKKSIQNINSRKEYRRQRFDITEELAEKSRLQEQYQQKINTLYIDYKNKLITIQEYFTLKEVYEKDMLECESRIKELQKMSNGLLEDFGDTLELSHEAEAFENEEKLTKDMIKCLIDRIEVFPDKAVQITFHYRDQFETILKRKTMMLASEADSMEQEAVQ